MENAHDSGEKASADLWEIRSRSLVSRTCTLSVFGSEWPLSQCVDYLPYAGKSMKDGGYEDGGGALLQGERQREFDPPIETDGGSLML